MLDTQALDALAALAASAPTSANSAGNGNNNIDLSSYAQIAQRLQEARAAAATAHNHNQAAVSRQADLSSIPTETLQAYLASAGLRSNAGPTASASNHAASNYGAARPGKLSHAHGSAFTGLPTNVPAQDPSAEARAIAINILMAHQQQQQDQQQHPLQQHQPPLPSMHLGHSQAQPLMALSESYADSSQRQYSLPSAALNQSPAPTHPLLALASPTAASAPLEATVPQQLPPRPYPQVATSSASLQSLQSQVPVAQQMVNVPSPPATAKGTKRAPPPSPSNCSVSSRNSKPPPKKRLARAKLQDTSTGNASLKSVINEWEDKKQAKRAANRLSAHLSRKRKKMFMENLKAENEDLRHKEQILHSIPDLIVVFDSSGSMPFVSPSVSRFLDFTTEELQDTSFWDRLTEDSVRLVKNAFMDALAEKRPDDDTQDSAPLWNGESRSVELVDREEGQIKLMTLKGTVHFSGESPECVCSIRREDSARRKSSNTTSSRSSSSASSSRNARENASPVPADPAAIVSHRISDVESIQGSRRF